MSWNFGDKPRSGTETALDACDYFLDEVLEMSTFMDAREQIRCLKHKELRQAVISGDERTTRVLLEALGDEKELVVNMAPGGANTLLFLACQSGYEQITKIMLEAGADGRSHTVTRYSPLYASVHHGNYNISKLLLDKFPELIQHMTVERWLALHAACINGYVNLVELLINYNYPECLLNTYRDEEGLWEWKLPFDPNQQDVTGQTSLYIASILGNKSLVHTLLNWKVKAYKVSSSEPNSAPITPTRKRISFGIQAIMSKLNISGEGDGLLKEDNSAVDKCPINLNLLCGAARETALLAAVRGGFLDVVALLLQHGADPNIVARPVEDQNDPKCSEEIYGLCNVPIAEACKQKSAAMVDLLLKYGARDEQGKALNIAVVNNDEVIVCRLLGKRVHPDSDYKINKKGLPATFEKDVLIPSVSNVTYSNLFPNVPSIIDWHNTNVQLPFIRSSWIVNGVLQLNPKLQTHPRVNEVALMAITRIDLSHNNLSTLPSEIFSLISLKYLNIAQNILEKLPQPIVARSPTDKPSEESYNCPVLEELYIQDNRLVTIPAEVFRLPSLLILDISNNKLQDLPFDMWKAPKLRELNIAFNLLKDLPVPPAHINFSTNQRLKKSVSESALTNDVVCKLTKYPSRTVTHQQLVHRNIWSNRLEVTDNDMKWNESKQEEGISQLSSLNVANNLFTSIPAALPCLAPNLTRLNLSYNSLRSMGHVTSYPATLKQLDLSHNEITCWPSLPRITESDPYLRCYSQPEKQGNDSSLCEEYTEKQFSKSGSNTSFRSTVLKSVCRHRKHLRLEALRTLILADNLLSRIQLSTDDIATFNESDEPDWSLVGVAKSKLIFPNLSMLDISNNCLKEIPPSLHELSSLSVLNISGNVDITDLPPHLGLLSRLWNLNTRGCLLQDPLKSMIESKKYKTMDIIGYLKSIYEDAQPYARMKLMVVGVHGIGKTTLLDLLRQGGNPKGRVSMDHWAKRMGHKNAYSKTNKGINISTVGVDIGTWVCDKKKKSPTSYGPVVFKTWDFGGQKEYYATHQYFLSKRSLYLVLWRITDGQKGLAEILQWLGNIQARAPNSPVIIVGTHYDAVGEFFSPQKAEELQQIIREKFIAVPDAEKIGLPRVIDSIEISCRTLHNIKLLSNIIYDTAFMLRSPGSKEPLLLQRVPASYVALEDVVTIITNNLKSVGSDPVLDAEAYKKLITEEMKLHNYKNFRDWAELNQATMFLHDNGVILHYDDATLRDFYFLDPQWLCDMLAHVVTVREINPFARTGIMKLEDLQLLFKSTNTLSNNNRSYIVNLLNKFEVALTWDARTLLIPSLLPTSEISIQNGATIVRISQRTKYRGMSMPSSSSVEEGLCTLPYDLRVEDEKKTPIKRVLLMTYFPSGFWSRLITRVLADEQIIEAVKNVYKFPIDCAEGLEMRTFVEKEASWSLWQTGLALYIGNVLVLKIWEVPFVGTSIYRNTNNKFKLKIDGLWNDINLSSSSILEITFPLSKVAIQRDLPKEAGNKETLAVSEASFSTISHLLALTVDHIDLLLEDWYPSLGTRFVHTSEGRFLITRLVICPKCLQKLSELSNEPSAHCSKGVQKFSLQQNKKYSGDEDSNALSMFAAYLNAAKERKSEDSLNLSDADSGVGPDSTGSSRNTSVDGHPLFGAPDNFALCYTWMIEECILSVYNQSKIVCPLHSEIEMIIVAPDVVFADIPEKYTISSESIMKGSLLGRGAFGFVFKATCKIQGARSFKSVAMKMLQPVPPGTRAKESAVLAYKIALGKWDRDPLQHSCKAYCTARQELAVLLTLKHPNIVPLVGICIKPLALVLELAPLGALDSILRQYRRSGAHVGPHTFQIMVLQAARAIEYLHRKRIIYRDLKSENVLVWDFPSPHSDDGPKCSVHIKIADYGISRITAPSGSKGFGGTEGYMAPEIIRYNGEEEYTEKVDCFSFGMFLYEIITLRQPFEGQESIKECILEGHRPALTMRETHFPTYCLDLMVLCWDELPKKRPSASQVVSILSAPECIQLLDVISLSHGSSAMCGLFNQLNLSEDELANYELWLPCSNSRIDVIEASYYKWFNYRNISCENRIQLDQLKGAQSKTTKISLLCCCVVEKSVWVGDSLGMLHAYRTCDYSHVFSYVLDPAVKSGVVSLIYLKNITRVAVGLSCGRVFLVDSTNIPSNCAFAEGSFVLTELCSGELLYSACAVWNVNEYELWCGETSGIINVFPIKDSVVSGHMVLFHVEEPKPSDKLRVARMYSTSQYIFSCLNPGNTVYQWSVAHKKIENKLDCSKLLPCSESLKSIAIEEHFNVNKCQISAIAVHGNEIYIGTTWGCLIVGDANTLRPITVFRPYENEIKAIITPPNNSTSLIATIGRRYRSLISRYTDMSSKLITGSDSFSQKKSSTGRENYIHCLLWRAQNWT